MSEDNVVHIRITGLTFKFKILKLGNRIFITFLTQSKANKYLSNENMCIILIDSFMMTLGALHVFLNK